MQIQSVSGRDALSLSVPQLPVDRTRRQQLRVFTARDDTTSIENDDAVQKFQHSRCQTMRDQNVVRSRANSRNDS